jgi:hypothetical protein
LWGRIHRLVGAFFLSRERHWRTRAAVVSAWAKLARALYIVSPAVTMSADARNRLCGVYHTEFIRSSLEIRISVREVETLASFFLRFCVHPHRAFPCCALQRTAGFPKYEALRGFDCVRFVAREALSTWAGRRTHGPCVPTNVVCVLSRERRLRTRRPRHGEALPMTVFCRERGVCGLGRPRHGEATYNRRKKGARMGALFIGFVFFSRSGSIGVPS